MFQWIVAVATVIGSTLADNYDNGEYGPDTANNATHPTAKEGNITIHYVTVGKLQNEFVPNSLVAQVGDIVSFQFFPSNHSVIRSAYGYPCIPIEDLGLPNVDPFYSGFHPVAAVLSNPPTWNVTVNHTDPIFYYCGAKGSCTDWGMVGAINANATQSIATQIRLARQADYMLLPGEPFPSEQQQESMASLAYTATQTETTVVTSTSTQAPSSPPPSKNTSSGLSGGETAGIAVGAAAAALLIAGFFFFLRRSRKLKQKLEMSEAGRGPARPDHPDMVSPAKYSSMATFPDQGWQNNQAAPPYRPWQDLNPWDRSPNKPADGFSQASPQMPSSPSEQYAELSPNRQYSTQQRVSSAPFELDTSHAAADQGNRFTA